MSIPLAQSCCLEVLGCPSGDLLWILFLHTRKLSPKSCQQPLACPYPPGEEGPRLCSLFSQDKATFPPSSRPAPPPLIHGNWEGFWSCVSVGLNSAHLGPCSVAQTPVPGLTAASSSPLTTLPHKAAGVVQKQKPPSFPLPPSLSSPNPGRRVSEVGWALCPALRTGQHSDP